MTEPKQWINMTRQEREAALAPQRAAHSDAVANGIDDAMALVRHPEAILPVNLRVTEVAYISFPVTLSEVQSYRAFGGLSAPLGVGGVGVFGGVSVPFWAMRQIDAGHVTVTNQRLIYTGGHYSREIRYDKLLAVGYDDEGVTVNVANRDKALYLRTEWAPVLATYVARLTS